MAKGDNLRDLPAFSEPTAIFPPNAELVFRLTRDSALFGKEADENLRPLEFVIYAEYEYGKEEYVEKNIIDLKPYFGSVLPQAPIVSKLDDINKAIRNIG